MLVKPFVLVLLRVVVGLLPHDGGPPLQIEPAAGRNQPRAALGKVPMKETDGPWPTMKVLGCQIISIHVYIYINEYLYNIQIFIYMLHINRN